MAKGSDKKRKLEQEQDTTTPKRHKVSEDSSVNPKQATNGKAHASPPVAISRRPGDEGRPAQANGASKKAKKRKSTQAVETDAVPEASLTEHTAGAEARTVESLHDGKKILKKGASQEGAELDNVRLRNEVALGAVNKKERKEQKKAKRNAAKAAKEADNASSNDVVSKEEEKAWRISPPSAGRYLEKDPLFVRDENDDDCLIAATAQEVQLLSLENSLVVRSHVIPDGRSVVCYSKSANDSQSVDIAYDNGNKVTWNWISQLTTHGTFPGQEKAIAMASALCSAKTEIYYIAKSGSQYSIFGERRRMYTTPRWLRSIQVLHDSAYIVCLSTTGVVVGARKTNKPQSDYTWVEIPSEMPLCCVEARSIFKDPTQKHQSKRPELVLALGNAEGQIHLYSDLRAIFASPSQAQIPAPRILHWHREPVSAVKFSRDGNYLISGGRETVLVLWQLETGKRTYLPHLTAEIERIVVNPDGTKYALQMGDNSIMVLSTSELKPVANFAGLQLPTLTEQLSAAGVVLPSTAAILHPKNPSQLLLSVPSTQPKSTRDPPTRPYLQTFDVQSSRHVSRQALARNNVTDFKTGPEHTSIIPPDVCNLAVSADGQWLATVDEWIQPASDMEHLVSRTRRLDADDDRELHDKQAARREIHLKFWKWNDAQGLWTLSTRIDAPHTRTSTGELLAGPGQILKLVSDPVSNAFATIGQDGKLKIWKAKTRTRHGIPLKETNGDDVVDWTCKRTVPLPLPPKLPGQAGSSVGAQNTPHEVREAALAISQDGSMLVCAFQVSLTASAMVHFVSTSTGAVVSSKAGLVPPEQEVVDLTFLDRFFVCLTRESFRIWDIVDDRHIGTTSFADDTQQQDDPCLATNHSEGTFAVLSYEKIHGTGISKPKVALYNPKQPESLFETYLPGKPVALLAANEGRGYTILFENGTIRNLSTTTSFTLPSATAAAQPALASAESSTALALVDQANEESELVDEQRQTLALPPVVYSASGVGSEDDRPVVRPEQLASIFDAGQTPVRDMFQSVMDLFARKPRPMDLLEVKIGA